ncbi:heme NO-binding domain-containing protein [Vitreimonas flagellata]|uniref:heme NO-binding domain-containing protein n=1 Tax=Vitreimonas flagellata TaxID=2560861 RepID=UPI0010755C0E|nr:heme NO-binding domain-containing protein [Vitreimonas flagellata]
MYGLIHSAARQMVLDQLGAEAWRRVLQRAGFDDLHFINGEVYSDEATFALIGAIVDENGIASDTLLFEFGRYWIGFVATSAFANAMAATGDDFVSFVDGLDRLHRSVRTAMPQARMPSFEVLSAIGGNVEILYVSERAGLDNFVAGLLQGLLEKFGARGAISYARADDGVVFSIALEARAAA